MKEKQEKCFEIDLSINESQGNRVDSRRKHAYITDRCVQILTER